MCHLGHGSVQILVHHPVVGQGRPRAQLLTPHGQAPLHSRLVVAAASHALGLCLGRGRDEQDHHGVGEAILDLARPLQVDLEQEIAPGRQIRRRGPVTVAEELGVLQEPSRCGVLVEGAGIDEDVGVLRFLRTTGPRRPRAAEDESRILLDEPTGDGALPRPARTGDDEDQDFAVWVSSASR
jgi:hypothetical protein